LETTLEGRRFQVAEDFNKNVKAVLNDVYWSPLLTVFNTVLNSSTNKEPG
jgi:hypothetical protein